MSLPPLTLILLAPPGGGKGTQARRLMKELNLSHLSTGQMLRQAQHDRTPIGIRAAEFIRAGLLVPDDMVLELVRDALQDDSTPSSGVILDGFPRTLAQAEALDELLALHGRAVDGVISLELSPETIVARLSSRRVCSSCGTEFSVVFRPPSVPGVCDECGGDLEARDDDSLAAVSNRLSVADEGRLQLKEHYGARGLLAEVDGEGSVEEVFARIRGALPRKGCYA